MRHTLHGRKGNNKLRLYYYLFIYYSRSGRSHVTAASAVSGGSIMFGVCHTTRAAARRRQLAGSYSPCNNGTRFAGWVTLGRQGRHVATGPRRNVLNTIQRQYQCIIDIFIGRWKKIIFFPYLFTNICFYQNEQTKSCRDFMRSRTINCFRVSQKLATAAHARLLEFAQQWIYLFSPRWHVWILCNTKIFQQLNKYFPSKTRASRK